MTVEHMSRLEPGNRSASPKQAMPMKGSQLYSLLGLEYGSESHYTSAHLLVEDTVGSQVRYLMWKFWSNRLENCVRIQFRVTSAKNEDQAMLEFSHFREVTAKCGFQAVHSILDLKFVGVSQHLVFAPL